ncbi:hypothetical protein LZ32DRAFT_623178 [Colletotrichum eremochloae]|nr:hypothetical protein LZ32DRAFT_623178 [Colletotrichum eremochloae]
MPLRVGGAAQLLTVCLDPPSQNGPVTVTATSSDPTVTFGNSGMPNVTLLFAELKTTVRTVSFNVGQTVTVQLSDVTSSDEDPDPLTEVQFNPATMTFTRANNYQYRSVEQELKVTLKNKQAALNDPLISHEAPAAKPSLNGDGHDKANVLQANYDSGSQTIKKKVTIPRSHIAIIRML